MFTNRSLKRDHRTFISISANPYNSWKIRSINGYEKYLFPNTQLVPKHRLHTKIDSARFIYPRDAMGDLLYRKTTNITPFYLPNYSLVETRSPIWTIKNVYPSKQIFHQVGSTATRRQASDRK